MKKLLALLLASATLFTFAACGESDPDKDNDEEVEEKDGESEEKEDGESSEGMTVEKSDNYSASSYFSYTDGTTTTVYCNGKKIGTYPYSDKYYYNEYNTTGSIQVLSDREKMVYISPDCVKIIEASAESIALPDYGSKFLYTVQDEYTGSYKLFLYDVSDDSNILLTDNVEEYTICFSADLSAAAYTAYHEDEHGITYVYNNGQVTAIPNVSEPYGISNNAERFYFENEDDAFVCLNPATGSETVIYESYIRDVLFNTERTQLLMTCSEGIGFYEVGSELKFVSDLNTYSYPNVINPQYGAADMSDLAGKYYEIYDNGSCAFYFDKNEGFVGVTPITYNALTSPDGSVLYTTDDVNIYTYTSGKASSYKKVFDGYVENFEVVNNNGVYVLDDEDILHYITADGDEIIAENVYSLTGTPNGTVIYESDAGVYLVKGTSRIRFGDMTYDLHAAANMIVYFDMDGNCFMSNGGISFKSFNECTVYCSTGPHAYYYG